MQGSTADRHVRSFPRSIDRGLIEATNVPIAMTASAAHFRDQLIAASLKRMSTPAHERRRATFRDQLIAASLKLQSSYRVRRYELRHFRDQLIAASLKRELLVAAAVAAIDHFRDQLIAASLKHRGIGR